MQVDRERLRRDIETNGQFGGIEVDEGHGRTVFTGTDADRRARDYFVGRLEDAGLAVRIDAVGNIRGRWAPSSVDENAAPIAVGSHLDSVAEGGIFDGPLGVYGGLEVVRAMQEADREPRRPIDVVCFTEEEGGQRFSSGQLGATVAVGKNSIEESLALTDDEGITAEAALDRIGYRGEGRLDASEWSAWFELHVEQSGRLEAMGVPVGVVTTIAGHSKCRGELVGESNHAGTTPIDRRRDALAAASEVVLDVERASHEYDGTALGTVGSLTVHPNKVTVVPGRVEFGVDIRGLEYDAMTDLFERIEATLDRVGEERGVDGAFRRTFEQPPTPMAERCRSAAHRAAERLGVEAVDLHSGAAHDTMHVAEVTDSALLFAPSRGGISHNPREWTDWADCATATAVLAGAIDELAAEPAT